MPLSDRRAVARAQGAPRRSPAVAPAALACLVAASPVAGPSAAADRAHRPVPAAAMPLSLPRDVDRDGVADSLDACPRSGRGVRVDLDGCLRFGPDADGVRFKPGSAWLDPAAERTLARALATLERFPRKRFEIRAYADPGPDAERGLGMALLRAEAVVRWFAARGVAARRGDVVAIAVSRRGTDADEGGNGGGSVDGRRGRGPRVELSLLR